MAKIEVLADKPGVESVWVVVEGITDAEVQKSNNYLNSLVKSEEQVSDAVARAFVQVVTTCPEANPSDLWQHVIYRHLRRLGWSDNTWKRVSGYALERALVTIYNPRLATQNLRMRMVSAGEANALLNKLGISGIKATKVDVFLEGKRGSEWLVFGSAHVKSSLAERVQDDVPASVAFQEKGLLSIVITMDSKSYPPPHGLGVNYGELGGRSAGVDKERLKRGYIEERGQFDGLFSFNLRTPPSPTKTKSGKRIFTMSMDEKQPDQLVRFLADGWRDHAKIKAP